MKRVFIIGIPVLVIGGLVGWRFKAKTDSNKTLGASAALKKNAPANAVLAKAVERDVIQTLEVVGSAQSPYDIKISPKATGIVELLTLREGDPVAANQVVARVDSDEINGQVAQAMSTLAEDRQRYTQAKLTQNPTNTGVYSNIRSGAANLASTEAEYNQSKVNYQALAASADATVVDAEAKVNQASAQVDSAQAQVQSAQANLDDAQAKYNRTYTLYKQAFVAAQDVDDAKAAYQVDKAALNVAQKGLAAAESNLKSTQAELDSTKAQASITKLKGVADVQAAKALVTAAEASLKNYHSQRYQIPAYEENLRALQSQVSTDEALLAQARARLDNTYLRSPIPGIVTARTADPGSVANPGTSILEVQYLKWLYVTAPVPVENSDQIHTGMSVDIKFDALPGKTFTGTISRVNPSADPTNRQFMIYVRLENPTEVVRPNMFSRIDIVTSRVHAPVVVPREAVTPGVNQRPATVIVVDSTNTAHIVSVKTGVEDAAGIQILDGVKTGDRVVVQMYGKIKDGQKVTVPTGGKGKGKKGASGSSDSGGGASSTAGTQTGTGTPAGGGS